MMNLKLLYITGLVILAIIMQGCKVKVMNSLSDTRGVEVKELYCRAVHYAIVTMFWYVLAIIVPNERAALFSQAAYYCCTDVLLVAFIHFCQYYVVNFNEIKPLKYIFYLAVVLDSIQLLSNAWTKVAFQVGYSTLPDGTECRVFYHDTIWYHIHLGLIYFLVLIIILALVGKIVETTRFYRVEYISVLLVFLLVIGLDCVYVYLNLALDSSLMLYGLLTITLYYMPFKIVPKRQINHMQTLLVKESNSVVLCFNIEGNCIYVNEKAKKIFKESISSKLLVENFYNWLGQDDYNEFGVIWQKEYREGDDVLYFEVSRHRLLGKNGDLIGTYYEMVDRTEPIKAQQREHYLSTHDWLTGIYNRECFYEMVDQLLEQNPDELYYMVCSDIKDFKLINELFGEQKGDEVLIELARLVKLHAKDRAVYGRLEGDHFALCMPKKRFMEEEFQGAMEELARKIDKSIYQMVIYVGVYPVKDRSITVNAMCDRAFMAMKRIEGDYQNTISYYDDKILERTLYEKKLVSEFDEAIAKRQFCIFLQPQTDCHGSVMGAEALVRWNHPDRGMVPPGDFISVFERSGLIHLLDAYVWECAAIKLRSWEKQGYPYYISVNISTRDFYYLDLYKTFTELVEKYEIDPAKLKLEITETALMNDPVRQFEIIDNLKNYGFQVEIDDFGSGYSSLNMLKDLKADVLKIDMGFLQKTQNDERSRVILKMIISMSRALHMEVVTEGVETSEQLDFLTEAGCEVFQGYYFSRPLPVDAFEEKYL